MNKAVVVAGGSCKCIDLLKQKSKNAFVVACDSGIGHCKAADIVPNVIIGDFDSAKKEDIAFFDSLGIERKTYPTKKNATDSEIGLDIAYEHGYWEIYFFGATGSRLDHSLTNIHLLAKYLKKGANVTIMNENNEITAFSGTFTANVKKGDTLSLIPFTQTVKVKYTKGLLYPVKDKKMYIDSSLGNSNVAGDDRVEIELESGIMLFMRCKDI